MKKIALVVAMVAASVSAFANPNNFMRAPDGSMVPKDCVRSAVERNKGWADAKSCAGAFWVVGAQTMDEYNKAMTPNPERQAQRAAEDKARREVEDAAKALRMEYVGKYKAIVADCPQPGSLSKFEQWGYEAHWKECQARWASLKAEYPAPANAAVY